MGYNVITNMQWFLRIGRNSYEAHPLQHTVLRYAVTVSRCQSPVFESVATAPPASGRAAFGDPAASSRARGTVEPSPPLSLHDNWRRR